MIWLTADDVVKLHSKVIQSTGGLDGLRDRAGLEAALAAPLQTFGGEDLFPGDVDKIARLGFVWPAITFSWTATNGLAPSPRSSC